MTRVNEGKVTKGALDEKTAILLKVVPFNILSQKELHDLAEKSYIKIYPKGSYIFQQGETSQGTIFIIVSGRTRIVVRQEEGQETTAGYRNPHDFFGVTALLTDEEYPVSVLAEEELKCLLVPHEVLESIMNNNAEFSSYFTYELSRRLREIYKSFMEEAREGFYAGAHPLRKRVSEIMTAPPVTCGYLDTVERVAQVMAENDVSSVVVMAPNGSPLGIITEKDLVSKVLAEEGPGNLKMKAHEIMSDNIISIPAEEFSYQALLLMVKHSIKHVIVARNGTVVGILTMRDLMRTRQAGALSIVNKIESQESLEELKKAVDDIDKVLQALVMERAYASEICPLITEFYDRLTRRILAMAEREMVAEGYGEPPTAYSWINMGSSGRMEQYSRTDQDNGIIFEDLPDNKSTKKAREYFLVFGEKVVNGLEKCGFERCEGQVMANNSQWCRSLTEWKNVVTNWIDDLDPENIRKMTIFLDFRHIWGYSPLTSALKDFVTDKFKNANTALLFLAEDALRYRAPLNIFRQIVTERSGDFKNQVNLKGAACVHIVDCIRLFCLREGIRETSTFKRLAEIKRRGVLNTDEVEFSETAFETLMMFRIREAVEKMSKGQTPNNYINPYNLSKKEQSLLRESFIVVNRLQNITSKYFRMYG